MFLEVDRSLMPWSHARRAAHPGARGGDGHDGRGGRRRRRTRGAATTPRRTCCSAPESLCTLDEVVGRKPRRHPSQPQAPRYPERSLNAERFLRTGAEMAAHYADRPELLEATLRVADRCEDDVLPGRARLPSLFADDDHALREIVESEAHGAYGSRLTAGPPRAARDGGGPDPAPGLRQPLPHRLGLRALTPASRASA